MIKDVAFYEYCLRDGLIIKDKADGIANIKRVGENEYSITIKGKKLILPTCSDIMKEKVTFTDSKKFTFMRDGDFLMIKETDTEGKNTYFVDVTLVVHDIAYDVFSYKPSPLTKNLALQKIEATPLDGVLPLLQVYNRHGVAVFGKKLDKYYLFWATPNEINLKNVSLEEGIYLRNGEVSAKGTNYMVYLKSRCKNFVSGEKEYYLNNEEGYQIPLKDQESVDRLLEKVEQLKI
ncbi:hypothetical protein BN1013_02157 [Candidatus Rubidus massiliensis]|nr:MAG: hypothetical protein BGO10_09670 [Chlamydia sp. 32-24]CDZ81621.1 hypothetical protein BN1013_02157 [Candidatus Rubidus massiliensis]